MTQNKIKKLAQKHGWKFICFQDNISMISFHKLIDKHPARINIYITKMTVSTSLFHPKLGATQMFRKHQKPKDVEKIFLNPRTHTQDGYRHKAGTL